MQLFKQLLLYVSRANRR